MRCPTCRKLVKENTEGKKAYCQGHEFVAPKPELKTYTVHLVARAYGDVEVEAGSSEEAEKLALRQTQNINWEVCEAEVDDTECLEPEVPCLCGRGECMECGGK